MLPSVPFPFHFNEINFRTATTRIIRSKGSIKPESLTQVLDEAPIIRNIDRSSRREESTSTVYTQRRVQSSSWPGQLGVARRSIPSPPKHEHFSTNTSIYHQPWWRPDVSCHRFNGAPLELSVPASVERVVLFDRSITKLLRKGCAVRDACPRSLFRSNPLWPGLDWRSLRLRRCFRGKIASNRSVSFLSRSLAV